MRQVTIESCEFGGTRLDGQSSVSTARRAKYCEDSGKPPTFRVVITRGAKKVIARSARELTDRLAEITPCLREFAEADPGTICFLLAFLEDRGRPVRDTPLWRDLGEVRGRPVDELLPVLTGNTLAWHHLDVDDFKPKLVRNRFNVATGRFVERGAKVA